MFLTKGSKSLTLKKQIKADIQGKKLQQTKTKYKILGVSSNKQIKV